MSELVINKFAQRDLERIVNYLRLELCNPQAADNHLAEVSRVYSLLRDNPEIFQLARDPALRLKGYRVAPINNYLMVYRHDGGSDTVHVLRFFHSLQDYARILK